jgi:GT2 family glycosyltransferase
MTSDDAAADRPRSDVRSAAERHDSGGDAVDRHSLSAGCVILTLGDRPTDLGRAVKSVVTQSDVDVDCLVVVNASTADFDDLAGARIYVTGRNVGIPGGRNMGARRVTGEVLLFLDDDAQLSTDSVLRRAVDRFVAEPSLGILSLRIIDPDGRPGARRHVPRLYVGDPAVGSEVTTFLGGACIVRRAVLDDVGGFPEDFFYAHEETSLAWRALDAGWRIRYAGDLSVYHPVTSPARHAHYHYLTARNRVLLARRHLPWPIAVLYLGVWSFASFLRAQPGGLMPTLRGFAEGFRHPVGTRKPMSWRTVLRMTRLGRPPIV